MLFLTDVFENGLGKFCATKYVLGFFSSAPILEVGKLPLQQYNQQQQLMLAVQ